MFFAHRFEFPVACLFRLLSSFSLSAVPLVNVRLFTTQTGEKMEPPKPPLSLPPSDLAGRLAEAKERSFIFLL